MNKYVGRYVVPALGCMTFLVATGCSIFKESLRLTTRITEGTHTV